MNVIPIEQKLTGMFQLRLICSPAILFPLSLIASCHVIPNPIFSCQVLQTPDHRRYSLLTAWLGFGAAERDSALI